MYNENLYFQTDYLLLKLVYSIVLPQADEVLKLHNAFRNPWKLLKTGLYIKNAQLQHFVMLKENATCRF